MADDDIELRISWDRLATNGSICEATLLEVHSMSPNGFRIDPKERCTYLPKIRHL
jgi:hypothetical protein